MAVPRASVIALLLAVAGCSDVVRLDGGGGEGGVGAGSADTSSGTGTAVGGGGGAGGTEQTAGAGGSGGRESLSCDDAPPGTFFVQIEEPEVTHTLVEGCDRFPQFPFATYTLGSCSGTSIAACGEDVPGRGSLYIFTDIGDAGPYEVLGQFGGRNVIATLVLSAFGDVGGVVSGELDGVLVSDPGGEEVGFHAELVLCRVPDPPPCP